MSIAIEVVVNVPAVTAVIFLPAVKVNVGVAPVLNCQPVGATSINWLVPTDISVAEPSVIVIPPIVVNEGDVPVAALLLHILVHPPPGVTVTAANPA